MFIISSYSIVLIILTDICASFEAKKGFFIRMGPFHFTQAHAGIIYLHLNIFESCGYHNTILLISVNIPLHISDG